MGKQTRRGGGGECASGLRARKLAERGTGACAISPRGACANPVAVLWRMVERRGKQNRVSWSSLKVSVLPLLRKLSV